MPREQRAVQAAQAERPAQADNAARALVAFGREFDNRRAIIEMGLAAGITIDHLRAVALSTFTRTPALMQCDPVSVVRAVSEAGQLGLEPTGLMGGAYLVPRGGQCTLLVGYRGLVMLAKRSGEVARVEARVVRDKDTFDYGYGLEPYLDHHPSRHPDPGNYSAAYAVIVYRDGGRQFDVMSLAEIEAIRKRSSAPAAGPWVTDWPEMAKKTVLRRLLKLAPLTIQVAAQLDEIDPEVRPEQAQTGGRQTELRHQLQAALEAEYGPDAPPVYGPPPNDPAVKVVGASRDGQAAGAEEAPAAAPTVEPVPACGIVHEGLGVGPCILPAGHQPGEHEDKGGQKWSQPRGH